MKAPAIESFRRSGANSDVLVATHRNGSSKKYFFSMIFVLCCRNHHAIDHNNAEEVYESSRNRELQEERREQRRPGGNASKWVVKEVLFLHAFRPLLQKSPRNRPSPCRSRTG